MQPCRLLVIRHAKAEQAAATDAERALSARGSADAEAAGVWLAEQRFQPDRVLVSAARRAAETWEAVCRGAGWDLAPELSRSLYTAEPETALDLLRETADSATAAVVGHNPTMATMVHLLDDGSGDPAVGEQLAAGGFPPGAVAVLEHDGGWADLAWGTARLVAYRSGR